MLRRLPQTQHQLPHSGLAEVDHCCAAERKIDKDCGETRARGEEDLRHRVRPGTRQALVDLMKYSGITEQGEAQH